MPDVTLRRVPQGQPGAGIAIARLHYSADPTMVGERLSSLRQKYTSDARWRREMEIEYEALEGQLLYPEYNDTHNVCDAFDDYWDRERWTIWMGADPHPRTPHCFVWLAINRYGDWIVVGELWPSMRVTIREYAEAIQFLESDSESKPSPFDWASGHRIQVYQRFMDTYGKTTANEADQEDYFQTYRKQARELTVEAVKANKPTEQISLNFRPALKGQNNLAKAQDAIGNMLLRRKDELTGEWSNPQLRVLAGCLETRSEFQNVRFPEGDPEKPSDERPLTYRKHALDCLHYMATGRPRFAMPVRASFNWEPIYPELGY